jgi:FkbM family methyltransferase
MVCVEFTMTTVELYRRLVPAAVRKPLWFARNGSRQRWRNTLADLRVWLGYPIARVRVEGIDLAVDLRDHGVGRPLFLRGGYERHEIEFLRHFLKPGMVVIDVGANIGYHTSIAARRVGPTGVVVAVEPEPHNFGLLSRNVSSNGLGNVRAAQLALGDQPGAALLFRSERNFGDHRLYGESDGRRETTRVEVTTLDDLIDRCALPSVDLIKMDVQGYEGKVIGGMKRLFAGQRGLSVLTEFWPDGIRNAGDSPEEFLATFERAGFSAFTVESMGTQRIAYDEVLGTLRPPDPKNPDGQFMNIIFRRA